MLVLQKINDDVIQIKNDQRKFIRSLAVFTLQVLDPLPHFQLAFGRIVENPIIDFVGFAAALTKRRLFDRLFHLIQFLSDLCHDLSPVKAFA